MQESKVEIKRLQSLQPSPSLRRKVKTGCRTCKLRKVKCDQERPACKRCVSTGRTCDGYGIWGGGSLSSLCVQAHSKQLPSQPLPVQFAADLDKDCFGWFVRNTIVKLPGAFGSRVWSGLICQATYTEPAVLNAVLAFSRAHQTQSLRLRGAVNGAGESKEQFILSHYGKAMHLLQPHLKIGSRTSICVALVTCLVFTCFEFLRDRYRTGMEHLRSGLNLLNSVGNRLGHPNLAWSSMGEDGLIETFSRLDVEAVMFSQYDRPLLIDQNLQSEAYPVVFESTRQAKRSLERLLRHLLRLTAECRNSTTKCHDDISDKCSTADQLQRIRRDLNWWQVSFEASRVRLYTEAGDVGSDAYTLGPIAYRMLRAYHTMATIMAATCTKPDDEMVYDAYIPQFELITSRAYDSAQAAVVNKLHQETASLYPYVADAAHLPALYYTAVKCRKSKIRKRAVMLLKQMPYKEGLWDSTLAAHVAEAVINLEEQGQSLGCSPPNQLTEDDSQMPMEMSRVSVMQVLLPDESDADVVLICKRRLCDRRSEALKIKTGTWRREAQE